MKVRNRKDQKYLDEEILRIRTLSQKFFQGKSSESLRASCSYVMDTKGKYIRPLLFLLSLRLLGGKLKHSHEIGLAIEMLHRASLVFDDIMDDSDMRHGKKALHKKRDLNNALLTGICLLPLSYGVLLKYSPPDMLAGATDIINRALLDMTEGQVLDIESKSYAGMNDYELMIYKKTASLIEASCTLGACFSSASKKEMWALANYGKYLGMAFQIRDDLHDLIGDEKCLGKPTGIDISGNKKTYFRARCAEKDKKYERQLSKLDKNKENLPPYALLASYVRLYTESGAVEDARTRIRFYVGLASRSLSSFPHSRYKERMLFVAQSLNVGL